MGRQGLLASVIAGVVLAGILACTMSTADSQLLTAASGVSQNLLQDFLKIRMSARASMMAARLTVAGIAPGGHRPGLESGQLRVHHRVLRVGGLWRLLRTGDALRLVLEAQQPAGRAGRHGVRRRDGVRLEIRRSPVRRRLEYLRAAPGLHRGERRHRAGSLATEEPSEAICRQFDSVGEPAGIPAISAPVTAASKEGAPAF